MHILFCDCNPYFISNVAQVFCNVTHIEKREKCKELKSKLFEAKII